MVETKKLLPCGQLLDESELESVVGGVISEEVVRSMFQWGFASWGVHSTLRGFHQIVKPDSPVLLRIMYGFCLCFMGANGGWVIGGALADTFSSSCEEDSKESEPSKNSEKLEN